MIKALFSLFAAAPAAHLEPAAQFATLLPHAPERVTSHAAADQRGGVRFFGAGAPGLELMLGAFNAAKALGFGDREAMCSALEALADAPVLRVSGKGARRINAKARRQFVRVLDRVRAEAFFDGPSP
jgi:hypothetical protein